MAAQKHSKQRAAILSELCSRCDHPTAEQLYADLKEKNPALSLATVYRNLRLLEKNGSVMRIVCGDADRFDGNAENHYHLTCTECGSVIDVELKNPSAINSLAKPFGGTVKGHSLMFFGTCKNCTENSKTR